MAQKKIIKLVGENYRGIQYFKDNNLLKQTFVLNDSTKDKFKKEMCSYGHKLGYYLVRIGNIKTILTLFLMDLIHSRIFKKIK
jgi:hypothetical protein